MSESVSRLDKVCDLSLLKPKNALKKAQLINDLLVLLRQKVADYPATYQLKACSEFLLYVCNIVENLVKKSYNINKKDLVKDVFKQLLALTEPELKILDASIEFLWSNELIQKIASSKKVVKWVKKKVEIFC